MPVVSRHRADPLHPVQLAPGLFAVQQAVGIRLGHGVEHHLQGGVASGDDLAGLAAQKVRKQPPGDGNTCHIAIVPGVDAVGDEVVGGQGDVVHLHDHVQLLPAGLSPGHIQVQAQGLLLLVGPAQGIPPAVPQGSFPDRFSYALSLFSHSAVSGRTGRHQHTTQSRKRQILVCVCIQLPMAARIPPSNCLWH